MGRWSARMFFSDQPCLQNPKRYYEDKQVATKEGWEDSRVKRDSSRGCIIKQMFCSFRIFKVNKLVLFEDGYLSNSEL
jgi:hypothetical protein